MRFVVPFAVRMSFWMKSYGQRGVVTQVPPPRVIVSWPETWTSSAAMMPDCLIVNWSLAPKPAKVEIDFSLKRLRRVLA